MKRKFLFASLFIALQLSTVYAQSLHSVIYKGDITFMQEFIKEINNPEHYLFLSKNELRILRNTIYAIHGYKFSSKDLNEHFRKFDWYAAKKENVDSELNENELRMINIISKIESNYPSKIPENLIGNWVMGVAASVESIGLIYLRLYPNGMITLGRNYSGKDADYIGLWSLDGNVFYSQSLYDGGESLWAYSWLGDREVKDFKAEIFEYGNETYKYYNFFTAAMFYPADKHPYNSF